ncbi:helix-turn-helix domain-containing protein [Paraflavitalea speifideaquila]|uniref:winged helix-turn-helix transcriptional regulator n=1 Tax=Paraflavitalea speifideaquila TaxID=3076558 RepID=UPI0028F082CE|nr:helix-turn-helix domain-containing protein [Paraflavitalea speifideiaquila]
MYEKKIKEDLDCGIYLAMKVFGAKWKPCIIDAINRGAKRPSELQRAINTASPRVIEMQLSELIRFGVITKEVFGGFPLYVEYSLTGLGKSILPILVQMEAWGQTNKEFIKSRNGDTEMDNKTEVSTCLVGEGRRSPNA